MSSTGLTQSAVSAYGLVVAVERNETTTLITMRGEADIAALPALTAVIDDVVAYSEGAVIVDLASIGFIDTATMRVLVDTWHALREQGRPLTLRAPSRIAMRMLSVLDLAHLVEPASQAA